MKQPLKSTTHCAAVKQSCGREALNVTLEKDDIDGTTPMLWELFILVTAAVTLVLQFKKNKTMLQQLPV